MRQDTYKLWHVSVRLEAEYWDIPARTREEAFEIASDDAMSGGDWTYFAEPIEENDDG